MVNIISMKLQSFTGMLLVEENKVMSKQTKKKEKKEIQTKNYSKPIRVVKGEDKKKKEEEERGHKRKRRMEKAKGGENGGGGEREEEERE